MWQELKSVFEYWIAQGVTIFRVDNPHTKAFPFWEWCIAEIKQNHPEVLFLAEAFTRPKIMYRLAKLGFSQSYTYFPWRNAKGELTAYLTELTQTPVREFFRPTSGRTRRTSSRSSCRLADVRRFDSPAARGYARRELRYLRSCIRADGAQAGAAGQ